MMETSMPGITGIVFIGKSRQLRNQLTSFYVSDWYTGFAFLLPIGLLSIIALIDTVVAADL
jgi:hypothetical protein